MLKKCEGEAAMIPAPHPAVLRQAAEALVRGSRRPIASIAAELGLPTGTVKTWCLRGGWRTKRGGAARRTSRTGRRDAPEGGSPLDGAALRAALRRHVARQIAQFDAALEADAVPDSARVLRDLGGLKRLLDELAVHDRSDAGGRHVEGAGPDDDGGSGAGEPDLPALRAEIARRYAAFAGERPDGCLPGEPAADPAARPPA